METLSEIVAEMRGRGEDGRMDRRLWLDYADRIEAIDSADAWRSLYTPGNAAAMREALVAALPIMRNCPFAYYGSTDVDAVVAVMERAISAPERNCDRPECATSKAAQDVWRKEDGGKTPYYEWLFAPAAERKGEGDGR